MKSGFGTLGVVDRDEDTVGCHECGRRFRMLVQHLRLAHEMTVAEYRRLHQLPATVPLYYLKAVAVKPRKRAGIGSCRQATRSGDAAQSSARAAAQCVSR